MDSSILPQLKDYIAIPAKSPMFAPDWQQQGLLDQVVRNAAQWVEAQKVAGLKLEILRLPGRTPLLFFEVAGTQDHAASRPTVLMYGHLDKQPEFDGWRRDLGPWTPVLDGDKLYGRGGADDGYAIYASIAAIQALKSQNTPHPRIVGLIETSEESGSGDLLPYIDALQPQLGDVGLVICLDSGAGNYDQLWLTTSLRGMASGTLKVQILTEGVHWGDASGVVPSSFPHPAPGAGPAGGQCHRPHPARQLSLRHPHRARAAGAGHRRHFGQHHLEHLPLGAARMRQLAAPVLPCP